MPSRLNPYLMFPGTARAAMETYQRVLGGDLSVMTFADTGAEGAPDPDGVMHAFLETPQGFALMASDLPPGMDHQPGNHISVSLSGDDAEFLRRCWDGLAEGGTVEVPLERQMWGDDFGQVRDRFGISWMVNITAAAPQG